MFPSAEATILHADADAFYASVEQRDDPGLRGKPVIVGGGVVLAASYEARAFGVRGAMGGRRARALCPQAVVVTPRWRAYIEASNALFDLFRDTAPAVEGISLEEAFLDVSGLERISGSPEAIARRLRAEARRRVGLRISVGVARTKLIAKVASAQAKPDGLCVVAPAGERAFLGPLPVGALWGVGPITTERLHAQGVRTVAELAAIPEPRLVALLGRGAGRQAHALAHGRDPRRVRHGRRRRSVGAQSALGRATRDLARLDRTLIGLVDRVTRRMRGSSRAGRTVILRMRFGDYTRASRSHTLPRPTATTRTVLAAARRLLAEATPLVADRGLTLIGVAVTNLDGPAQLGLPLDGADAERLDDATDEVRDEFGTRSLGRAVMLDRGGLAGGDWPPEPGSFPTRGSDRPPGQDTWGGSPLGT